MLQSGWLRWYGLCLGNLLLLSTFLGFTSWLWRQSVLSLCPLTLNALADPWVGFQMVSDLLLAFLNTPPLSVRGGPLLSQGTSG